MQIFGIFCYLQKNKNKCKKSLTLFLKSARSRQYHTTRLSSYAPNANKNPQSACYSLYFGAGAPVKKRVKFRHGPQKRVTELPPIGQVFYLTWSNIRRAGASARAKCFSDGVPCADYSAVPNQCQVFSVTPSIFE